MRMKKVKKLLLMLMAPLFTLFVSWALSITHEFNWHGIIIFVSVITLLEIWLAFRCPQKLLSASIGWVLSGVLFAFIATKGLLAVYTNLFETVALAIFAFTIFFICIPTMIRAQKQKP